MNVTHTEQRSLMPAEEHTGTVFIVIANQALSAKVAADTVFATAGDMNLHLEPDAAEHFGLELIKAAAELRHERATAAALAAATAATELELAASEHDLTRYDELVAARDDAAEPPAGDEGAA